MSERNKKTGIKKETYCISIDKKDAEKIRKILKKKELLNFNYLPETQKNKVIFPVINETKKIKKLGFIILERKLRQVKQKKGSLADLLEQKGIKSDEIVKSFDVIGDIAIIDIPEKLKKHKEHKKEIANAILSIHPNIKTVAEKVSPVSGVYRIRKVKVIAGEKKTETIHTETGCRFKLDINKVYFSPRLVFERQRIANLVKNGKKCETVFVPFVGVGPFAIIIAKNNQDSIVYANELNPNAFKYLKENIKLNKTYNVIPIKGDIKKVAKDYKNKADRIIMPLPMSSQSYLNSAFLIARKNCTIHIYLFVKNKKEAEEIVKSAAKKFRKKIKILNTRKVRDYSASIIEVVVDFQVKR